MSKGQGIWLDLPTFIDLTSGPPRRLSIFNPDTGAMERVGTTTGRGAVYFRGDPPAFVVMGGEMVLIEGRT